MNIRGKKLNMSQIFQDDGKVIPVTVVLIEDEVSQELLNKDIVVIGKSKGKGFTGVVKRFGFKGGPATHGQSDRHRAPGSSGQTTTPGRVYKGKRRSGRHGNKKVTLKGLRIVDVNIENKNIKITGPLPGGRNSEVLISVVE